MKKNKLIAAMLVVIMALTITCTQAFAANTGDPYAELDYTDAAIEQLKAADEHAFTTGSRGSAESTGIIGSSTNDTSGGYGTIEHHSDCITWSLKDGVLILTGSGYTVSGNEYSGISPFYNNAYIETIIICDNITDTGVLFRNLPNLKTVIVMNGTNTGIISDAPNLKNIIVGANMANNTAFATTVSSSTGRTITTKIIALSDTVTTESVTNETVKNTYSADKEIEFIGKNKIIRKQAETAWQSYNGYRTMDELVSMAKSAIADANLPDYALAMIPTELGGTAGAYDPVDDITVSAWAEDYMRTAIENDLVPSYLLNIDFTKPITRAQFCALAVQTYQSITGETLTDDKYRSDRYALFDGHIVFDDIYDNSLSEDIEKAYSLGVINGYGNYKFGPDDTLTREQSAVVLMRLAEALGKPLTKASSVPFTDLVATWSADGIAHAYGSGIMVGVTNTTFSPSSAYTAEQSVVTMVRMMEHYNK